MMYLLCMNTNAKCRQAGFFFFVSGCFEGRQNSTLVAAAEKMVTRHSIFDDCNCVIIVSSFSGFYFYYSDT